jgi:hypothetical protein
MKKDDLFRFTCGADDCDRRAVSRLHEEITLPDLASDETPPAMITIGELRGYCHKCGVGTVTSAEWALSQVCRDCSGKEVAPVRRRCRTKAPATRLLQRKASELSVASTRGYKSDAD